MSIIALMKNEDKFDFVDMCNSKRYLVKAGGTLHVPLEVAQFFCGDLSLEGKDREKSIAVARERRGQGYSELVTYEPLDDGFSSEEEVRVPKVPLKRQTIK